MGIVGIVYVLWGWSMSFSDGFSGDGKLFANPFTLFGLKDVTPDNYIYVMFQLTFAVITAALISGAIADRVRLSAWVVFLPLWVTLSYFPLAHMVFGCSTRPHRRPGSARRTTPAARPCTSTPVSPAWCSP